MDIYIWISISENSWISRGVHIWKATSMEICKSLSIKLISIYRNPSLYIHVDIHAWICIYAYPYIDINMRKSACGSPRVAVHWWMSINISIYYKPSMDIHVWFLRKHTHIWISVYGCLFETPHMDIHLWISVNGSVHMDIHLWIFTFGDPLKHMHRWISIYGYPYMEIQIWIVCFWMLIWLYAV